MTADTSVVAYAKEVYAAGKTVGYDSPEATRLKAEIDRGDMPSNEDLLDLAMSVQKLTILWAEQQTGSHEPKR